MNEGREIEYDYIVEEFAGEFKTDPAAVRDVVEKYKVNPSADLVREFNVLYPGNDVEDIANFDIKDLPPTVKRECLYLQSPKGKDKLPSKHYALKEVILDDLRRARNHNKALMGTAYKRHDMDNFKRFNANQLAVKVISNSFYGASGNKNFAHYDPDVGASITWAARQCIGQLTHALKSEELYVDKEFLEQPKIKEWSEYLENLGLISYEPLPKERYPELKSMQRKVQRRIFTDVYEVDTSKEIFIMHKPSCEVVYQDTDSNYFECGGVQKLFFGTATHDPNNKEENAKFVCSPKLMHDAMVTMVTLDFLLCKAVDLIIDRFPIGLGFEGSFQVARYLNRKKKYYGIKAADDDGNVFMFELPKEAYNEDGTLKDNFDDWWSPGKKTIPMSTGTFLLLNEKKLLVEKIFIPDYMGTMSCKITGVDVTRRDQYRMINFYHVMIMSIDLQYCRYDFERKEWAGISPNRTMMEVVTEAMEHFHRYIQQICRIASFETDVRPEVWFTIEDFMKNQRYDPDSDNEVRALVERYKVEGEKNKHVLDYIPHIGERLYFIVENSPEAEDAVRRGLKGTITLKNIRKSAQEFDDNFTSKYPEEWFDKQVGTLNISYKDWKTAKMISMLYIKHYVSSLASAIALYVFGERFPAEATQIDQGTMTSKEIGDLVTKCQKKIADELVAKYYPSLKVKKIKTAEDLTKSMKIPKKELSSRDKVLNDLFIDLFRRPYEPENRLKFLGSVQRHIEAIDRRVQLMDRVYRQVKQDEMVIPRFPRGSEEEKIYLTWRSNIEALPRDKERYEVKLKKLIKVLMLIRYE